jgi:two-component sensor histidine kinase
VLDKLLSLIQETNAHRRIRYHVADLRLTAKQGTSVALVVNELVSNAIKHGNSDVEVTFAERGDGKAALVVLDDGAGFPPDFDPVRAANTGLELVLSLTKWDLNGQVCYDNRPEGGGRVTILMPLPAGE